MEFSDRQPRPAKATRPPHLLLTCSLLLALTSCSTVKISTDPDRVTGGGIQAARLIGGLVSVPFVALKRVAESGAELLETGRILEKSGSLENAAACYFKAAVDAHELLAAGEVDPASEAGLALIELHNSSLARFAELWADGARFATSGEHVHVRHEDIDFAIRLAPGSDFRYRYFDEMVAAESISGKGVVEQKRQGYGAAMVGSRLRTPDREAEMRFYPKTLRVPVTLLIDEVRDVGPTRQVDVRIVNPALHATVDVGGHRLPLEADFSAGIEMLLNGRNATWWGLTGFFDSKARTEAAGIYLLEPYDPERIPVMLTHGLASVPIIWRDLVPELAAEPDIGRRYQFMLFTYPSAYSIAQSARLFRNQLAELRALYDPEGDDPLSNDMVAIGHSMGGVLTHLLVAEVGDIMWQQISDTPLDELPFTEEQKSNIRSLVYFDPDPAVTRAVFLSTPHRGATMAEAGFADWLSRLVALPADVLAVSTAVLDPTALNALKIDYGRKMTSVQSLRPDSPVAIGLDLAPYKDGVVYHSIIGDQGLGNSPDSSDGAVEYWSSHQEGAASELIVPTGHASYPHPMTVAEVKRILRLHLRE